MSKHDDMIDAMTNIDIAQVEAQVIAYRSKQDKIAQYAQNYGMGLDTLKTLMAALDAAGVPKEIDGWVYEWKCHKCHEELTVGVQNRSKLNPPQHPAIDVCPFCKHTILEEEEDVKLKFRTIYTEDLRRVYEQVQENNKVAAIRELRNHRKEHGGDASLKTCKTDVEEMMAEYQDIKGRKD